MGLTVLEICAGAGGQASGLDYAGFSPAALIEIDPWACKTLRTHWNPDLVLEADVADIDGHQFQGVDLLAGGVPCPPFSVAGKQLGARDERDLFPEILRLAKESSPRAILVENVPGLLAPRFDDYREGLATRLNTLGFTPGWRILNACDFGVPQLRPRVVMVALREADREFFSWPAGNTQPPPSVGEILLPLMQNKGWKGAKAWAKYANGIAPTLVGGSKKHGGPDLGPTRAKRAWAAIGVDGHGLADEPPSPDFSGFPRLTVPMTALVQGFPADWEIEGRKTAAYRQVGNAFPPPVAEAVGRAIIRAWKAADKRASGEGASEPVAV